MTRRVHHVNEVALPGNSHVLGLDSYAPLTLDIHRVQVLSLHFPSRYGPGQFKNAVSQSRLTVVNMGDNTDGAELR